MIEEAIMTRLHYADLARKPLDVLDMTSLTIDEFQLLLHVSSLYLFLRVH